MTIYYWMLRGSHPPLLLITRYLKNKPNIHPYMC